MNYTFKQFPKHVILATYDQAPRETGTVQTEQRHRAGGSCQRRHKKTQNLALTQEKNIVRHILLLAPSYLACFGLVDTATPAFGQGFPLKQLWEITKGKGISAAWSGAWDHVKNLDGDSARSCPLEQERRNRGKEVSEKVLLLPGLNLSFRQKESWW